METGSLDTEAPLVVIVGPTASGKTSLAIDLAKRFDGEIICADSRTIYKGMDIGTAKPTVKEQDGVPHWGLDLVEPGERFTAADFKDYANRKIADIRERGKVPFLVGGTGLYVFGVLYDYQYGSTSVVDNHTGSKNALYDGQYHAKFVVEKRTELEKMTLFELQNYCIKNNIDLPENSKNKRYVIRAIEQNGINNSKNNEPLCNSYIVGIATERDLLRTRIEHRSEQLFTNGVVDEATKLGKKYGWDSEAMTGNIYPLVRSYINGEISLEQVKALFVTRDWQLAKRQLTWFKRSPDITWLNLADANTFLSGVLEKRRKS